MGSSRRGLILVFAILSASLLAPGPFADIEGYKSCGSATQQVVGRRLLALIAGVFPAAGRSKPMTFTECKKALESSDEHGQRESLVRSMVQRLDSVISEALRVRAGNPRFHSDLETVLEQDGVDYQHDVLVADSEQGDISCLVYNLPLGLTGAGRRVVARLGTRGPGPGNPWELKALEDPSGLFREVENYPVHKIDFWRSAGGLHVVLQGHLGMGMGRDALSVWSVDKTQCVWSHQLAFAESYELNLTENGLSMTVLAGDAVDGGIKSTWRREEYVWRDGSLALKDSRVIKEEVHSPAWDPNRSEKP